MFMIDIDCPDLDCCIPNCPYLMFGRETEAWCDDHCRCLYDDRCYVCKKCKYAYKCKRESEDEING